MKSVLTLVKWYPIVLTVFVIVTTIGSFLYQGLDALLWPVFGHSIFSNGIMWVFSIKMHFCRWHRVLLANLMFVMVVTWFDVNLLCFPDAVQYLSWILSITAASVVLAAILYSRYGCFKKYAARGH